MFLPESSSRPRSLGDLLTWGVLVGPGVILNKDGSLSAGWSYRGPDVDSSTPEELLAQADHLNRALLDLGDGWALHADAVRVPAPDYPEHGAWPDPVTRLIDSERRLDWRRNAAFATRSALILTYLPPPDVDRRLRRFLLSGPAPDLLRAANPLQAFTDRITSLEDRIGSALRLERLDDEALLSHLHFCLTGLHHRVAVSPEPFFLDTLASQDFCAGLAPRVGSQHIAVLSFSGLPLATTPGLTDFLCRIGIPLRFSTRFLPLDPSTAERVLKQWRRSWLQSRRGLWFLVSSAFAPSPTERSPQEASQDHHSLDMLADVDQAMAEVRRAEIRYGYYTAVLVLHRDSPERLADDIRILTRFAHQHGLPLRVESVNAVEAYLGSLPGHVRPNLRRPLVSTRNLAHLLPVTSVWAGEPVNPSPMSPPGGHPALLWTTTEGSTPFHLNLHVQDVGHSLIVGPTGSGKSALVANLISAFFRYPNARVVAFDKGLSYYALTAAAGGAHYSIGAEDCPLAFCPLGQVDDPAEFAWALEWLDGLFYLSSGQPLTPDLRESLSRALQLVAAHGSRTLTNLGFKLQQTALRTALRSYTVESQTIGGVLLDAERDSLSSSSLLTFEMSALMQLGPRYVVPTLTYLFHRIEQRLDGSPTLLVLDEAWIYLSDPVFSAQLRSWLKEARKRNASVLFITQSLADLAQSSLREVLVESCPTKILLPAPQANTTTAASFYEALGLNARQREIIASATPKSEYYVVSPSGNRLIRPRFGPVGLAFCGAGSPEHLRRIRSLELAYGSRWPTQWLRELDLPTWADELAAVPTQGGVD